MERTDAWITHNRRLSRDFEGTYTSGEAFIYLAVYCIDRTVSRWYHFYMDKTQKARTVRLNQQDIEALKTVREIYGLTSDNEAIRLALRIASRGGHSEHVPPSQAPNKERPFHPSP